MKYQRKTIDGVVAGSIEHRKLDDERHGLRNRIADNAMVGRINEDDNDRLRGIEVQMGKLNKACQEHYQNQGRGGL